METREESEKSELLLNATVGYKTMACDRCNTQLKHLDTEIYFGIWNDFVYCEPCLIDKYKENQ